MDNAIIGQLFDLQHYSDRLRIYGQNKDFFKFWVLREYNTLTLLRVISEKFSEVPADALSDYELKFQDISELPYAFNLAEDSNTTLAANNKFKVLTKFAVLLDTSTRLHIAGMYCKDVVTAHTDFSATRSIADGIISNEIARVIDISPSDGTHSIVTVKRGHPADSYTGTAPAITTDMKITIVNVANRANDLAKMPITSTGGDSVNYLQITRRPYGTGELVKSGVETFMQGQALTLEYTKCEKFVTKLVERAIIGGRMSKKIVGDNLEYETGGILEFIPKDEDHILSFGFRVPSISRINEIVRKAATVSGVNELWWFTGSILGQQIQDAYSGNSVYIVNTDLSIRYRVMVHTITNTARDCVVHHVSAPILDEMGLSDAGLMLNLTNYNYDEKYPLGCFQVGYKEKFTDFPEDSDSYASNQGFKGTWRELAGKWGVLRRMKNTHFMTINPAPLNNQ